MLTVGDDGKVDLGLGEARQYVDHNVEVLVEDFLVAVEACVVGVAVRGRTVAVLRGQRLREEKRRDRQIDRQTDREGSGREGLAEGVASGCQSE